MTAADPVAARLAAAGCVYAEEEAGLLRAEAPDEGRLDALVAARVAGTPLEHVLGWASFRGLRVRVTPGVFVPRARTELLVDVAVAGLAPGAVVAEPCCGSGAVALALHRAVPGLRMHAVDLDPAAVACAAANLAGTRTRLHRGDLLDPLPAELLGRVDLVVASPPYVPTAALPLLPREARDHEPRAALDGGPSGTVPHRRLLAAAPRWLAPGGRVLLEVGAAQAAALADHCRARGLAAEVHRDAERDATVVAASAVSPGSRRPARTPPGPPSGAPAPAGPAPSRS